MKIRNTMRRHRCRRHSNEVCSMYDTVRGFTLKVKHYTGGEGWGRLRLWPAPYLDWSSNNALCMVFKRKLLDISHRSHSVKFFWQFYTSLIVFESARLENKSLGRFEQTIFCIYVTHLMWNSLFNRTIKTNFPVPVVKKTEINKKIDNLPVSTYFRFR